MTKRARAFCSGKVVDTINNDRTVQVFRGSDRSNTCGQVIKKGKEMSRKYPEPRYSVLIECVITKE